MSDASRRSPVATVVVTTHNRQELASRAVASALGQTMRDVDVVVVDDGSDPPFALETRDARVRLIRRDRAGGVCAARNVGLATAAGAWITFLDDDDVLEPDMLERSVAAAEASTLPAPVAVNAAVRVLAVDGSDGQVLVPAVALRRGEDYVLEGRGAGGRAANSFVVPTAVLRDIGGWDEEIWSFQHDDLGLRLNEAASIQGVADALYRMTTHRAERVSERLDVIPHDMERTLEKHPAAFARHRRAHARYMGRLSHYHLKAGAWRAAVRWSARGVRRDPTALRCWGYFGAALAGPYALRVHRWLTPPESTVSPGVLARRRARKGLHLLARYPRAAVGIPAAWITRAALRRRVPRASIEVDRAVLVCCIYRAANAGFVIPLCEEARRRGWTVRLWALDEPVAELADLTVGRGKGAKFPLLNELVRDVAMDRFDWVVVADDDLVFEHGALADLLAVAERGDLDLVQPAHTELSHREIELGVRRMFSIARRTTFVEIGPLFAVRHPWVRDVVPFSGGHTMGWGLELEWYDLERRGARLGVVDAVPIRHVRPVGKGYAKRDERARLDAAVAARGLASFADIQRVTATWRVWRARPSWGG